MALRGSGVYLKPLGRLFQVGTLGETTDGQLLDRFASGQSEAAFEALLDRHGPMVLRVCRGVLSNAHDAEDAFQATFLVLARRARSVRKRESLASWLHGVAVRVAVRSKAQAARRLQHEGRAAMLATARGPSTMEPAIAWAELHEEIERLPERYRAPVVLCDLEGCTHEEAARRLSCPLGTVKTRLTRARERLRSRLTRCGYAPVANAPMVLPLFNSTAVPSSLVNSTVSAAVGLAGPVGLASASAVALAEGVLKVMLLYKLKIGLAAVMATATLLTGAGFVVHQASGDQPTPGPGGGKTAIRETAPPYVVEPPDVLLVEVLEALPGRPISGERLVRPDGKISLGFYGEIYVSGLTTMEIKVKVIERLRKWLGDETLGLEGEKNGEKYQIAPQDSDRVFVDVTAYNSKVYYVEGEVNQPGKLPIKGKETVLDALHNAGGITSRADRGKIRLIRPHPAPHHPASVLPVDYEEITVGLDSLTNYPLMAGDRLVVPRDPKVEPWTDAPNSKRANHETAPDSSGADDKGIAERKAGQIRQEIVIAARQRLEAQQAFYEEGRITVNRFVDASCQLMNAEQLVASTTGARIAAAKAHLERVRAIERHEQDGLEKGRGTRADLKEAKSARIVAELMLAQERERISEAGRMGKTEARLNDLERKIDLILQAVQRK